MALTKETHNREIVIRFDDAGNYASSDITRIEVVKDDGAVVSIKSLPPEIVTNAELQAAMSSEQAALTAQLAAMQAERDTALADKETAETEKADAEAAKAAAEAAIEAANATNATAIAEKQAELDALNAKLKPVDEEGFAVLTPIQIRLGLLGGGVKAAQVDATIAAIPDDTQRASAEYFWEYSTSYHRDHPLIGQLGAGLGLSNEQIDAMWSAAAQL